MKFAARMQHLKSSETRELLSLTQNTGIISFAGGLPAVEGFPSKQISEVMSRVLEHNAEKALQYSSTEGYLPLREMIASRMNARHRCSITYENIIITSGSQQGLDLIGKIFLDEGDALLLESPTYLAAINAFRAYMPQLIEVKADHDGMIIDDLEEKICRTNKARLIYVIPDFQNPTGKTWSARRREMLVRTARQHDLQIVEDSPYYEIRFAGDNIPMLYSIGKERGVINTGTFSKIFCPGFRLGWIAAEKEVIRQLSLAKQGTDLHTPVLTQICLAEFINEYGLDSNIEKIKGIYLERRDIMIKCLEKYFPGKASFTRPRGGMFIWVTLQEDADTRTIYKRALEEGVSFVPGHSFYPCIPRYNTMRLNFSNMPPEKIEEGIKKLGNLLSTATR